MSDNVEYQYGIEHYRFPVSLGHSLHRGPWTRKESLDWIREAEEDGAKTDVFRLVRRPIVADWEPAE